MIGELFERMHASGRAAVLSGEHQREDAPWVTGRWGHSVVALLAGDAAAALDAWCDEAAVVSGPGHWRSGRLGRAHVTVRALAPYSEDRDPNAMARCWAAFEEVLVSPVHLSLDGLLLTPAGVLVRGRDLDGGGDALRSAFGEALGSDGWLEDAAFSNGRDPIWYCTLLHFAGPVVDPPALVEWVEASARNPMGTVRLETFSLCRWNLDEFGMAPTVLSQRSVGTDTGDPG